MDKHLKFTKRIKQLVLLLFLISAVYGGVRLYYWITDGFTIANISSTFPHDPRWEVRSLTAQEAELRDSILSQEFKYMGKGCQAYVFLSDDGEYVLKFFKYQRFHPQPWLNYLTFIPGMDTYREGKVKKYNRKLEGVQNSWKIAFENLQVESGLIFVHLNKSNNLNKTLTIYDKMGVKHQLNIDDYEFLIQRKATMLCAYIKDLLKKGDMAGAKQLIVRITDTITSEYKRGFADNDHALMQNTGVFNGYPFHIDVGQFMYNESVKDPEVYKQELFSKMFRFHKWLRMQSPELGKFLEDHMRGIIGEQYDSMKPYFKPHE